MLALVFKRDNISDKLLASYEDLYKHFKNFITNSLTHRKNILQPSNMLHKKTSFKELVSPELESRFLKVKWG